MDIRTTETSDKMTKAALVVPSNIEAEQAVLGALLIDPDAIIKVAPITRADDFYLEKHAWIFEAAYALHERREPIDFLTIVSELERRGKLSDVGGAAYITALINAVPTAVHVEHYAQIVERTSTLRRLISASGEIAGLAYDGAEEIDAVIDHAEQVIFAVAQRRMTREMIPMRLAVNQFFDRLDYVQKHQGEILGVSTGFIDLDRLLGGFQPSDLVIVAGRPGSGKTAFALSIIQHAALLKKKRIALFSLEMSAEQLVQRLVAGKAKIDSQDLRIGRIRDDQYSELVKATGELSEAQIFIDDSAVVTPLEIRAKARRLQSEYGLDMVVIDYLQLMTIRGRIENRVQEISQISRQLKELARELKVPVVALSQLSRAVESRQDHRPQLADLRESGCLTGDTLIYLPDDGTYRPIEQLIGRAGLRVLALNPQTWRLEPAIVTRSFSTGIKPVYRLTTRLGRTIRATANHKFLTIAGWQRLDELREGTRIALPRCLPSPTRATLSDAELALLGHLIGDGCALPRHAIQYTTRELGIAETVADLAKQIFGDGIVPRIRKERNWYQVYLSARQHLTHDTHNPITDWLGTLGIFGLRSFEKRVPDQVFAQPMHGIAVFLRHLWATDGCIHLSHGKRHYAGVYYASSSFQLARAVQSLLLRPGINARFSRHAQTNKGRDQYHISVSGKSDLVQFVSVVGALGDSKTTHRTAILEHVAARVENTNRDVLPREAWRLWAVPAMQTVGLTTRQMQSALGNAYCGTTLYKQNLSRHRAARLADVVRSEELAKLAQSDVYWDEISAIEPDGETPVFDLTVEGSHNFVAGDIIVHNSIEQDADVVMFIFREKTYYPTLEKWQAAHPHKEWPDKIAELIVAKHRHGPIKDLQLLFIEEQAKFDNLLIARDNEPL